jgi:cytoskeletal protein CcmA (bactofilin family)
VERTMGADRFVAGCPISVLQAVAGDLMAAGCDVDVLAEVSGDLVLLGGHLRLAAPVKQGLYGAGGRVSIDSAIQRNVRVAGGSVELGPNSKVAGNVSVAGGKVEIDGAIGGYLQAGAGRVRINGSVEGDVEVGADELELGPNAVIQGKLRYTSRQEIQRDASAVVRGGVERVERGEGWPASHHWMGGGKRAKHWIWSLGLLVAAAILVLALPQLFKGVAETARTRWGYSLLVGFILLVCVPVCALIAMVTVIGIPLALVVMALYLTVLLVGYVSAGIALGDAALQRWRSQSGANQGWRILAAVLGMLLISLLGRVPMIGWLVTLAAMLTGIGALLTQLRSGLTGHSAAKT